MQGLVVLVTGGASGLGLACMKRFARQGAQVVICDLPSSKGNEVVTNWSNTGVVKEVDSNQTVDQTANPLNPRLEERVNALTADKTVSKVPASSISPATSTDLLNPSFIPADVTNEEQVKAMFDKIKKDYGKLDVVLNCVGVGIAMRTYNINKHTMHGLKEFQRVLNVNVTGTFNIIRMACHVMADNKVDSDGQRGVIVNTASVAAYDGQIGQTAYAASKGAIVSMTLPLARDLSCMGIRVCTIAPGVFHTPMLAALPDRVRALLGSMVPFPPRVGRSDDFAHLAQSIVENRYLNGEVIRLDGALRMPP